MKLVLVCRVWTGHRPGGMPNVLHDRAVELARLGHEVHVLTTGGLAQCAEEEGVQVHSLDCPPQIYSDAFARECESRVNHLAPGLLHLDSYDRDRCWWSGRPNVAVSMHGLAFGGWLTKLNLARLGRGVFDPHDTQWTDEARQLAEARVVIAVSRWELTIMRQIYGLTHARLVYNPIGSWFFNLPRTPRPKAGRFFCAGMALHHERGFDIAAAAAERAGVELITARGVPREKMPSLYDHCDALVLPTFLSQGYDLTVAESLTRGRPVIASAAGSYLDELEDMPGTVLLAPGASIEEWARILKSDLPEVPDGVANRHQPAQHVESWLEAVA